MNTRNTDFCRPPVTHRLWVMRTGRRGISID